MAAVFATDLEKSLTDVANNMGNEIIRLRAALNAIAFYDDFMSKETAQAMMGIARDALKPKL